MERDNRKMMEEEKWTLVIVPKTGFFKLDLGELWRYRDLLVMYIRRDIVTFYKQTILGPLWVYIATVVYCSDVYVCVWRHCRYLLQTGFPGHCFIWRGCCVGIILPSV